MTNTRDRCTRELLEHLGWATAFVAALALLVACSVWPSPAATPTAPMPTCEATGTLEACPIPGMTDTLPACTLAPDFTGTDGVTHCLPSPTPKQATGVPDLTATGTAVSSPILSATQTGTATASPVSTSTGTAAQTPSPTRAPAETATTTPSIAPPPPTGTPVPASSYWHTYSDEALGISFDYWCQLEKKDDTLRFTDQTEMAIVPANGLSLEEYAAARFASWPADLRPVRDDSLLNHDPPGVTIIRYEVYHIIYDTYFHRDDSIYRFSAMMRILATCNAQSLGVDAIEAYYRTMQSFRFLPPR